MPPRTQKFPRHGQPKGAKQSDSQRRGAGMLRGNFEAYVKWMLKYWDKTSLVLPMPPNMANANLHWRTKKAARETYFEHLDKLRTLRLLPVPPAVPFNRAVITATLVLANRMDTDNAIARTKFCLDFFVRNGYLVEDRADVLRWGEMPKQIITRSEPQRIIFTIREDIDVNQN